LGAVFFMRSVSYQIVVKGKQATGQGEAMQENHKGLKLGSGQAYDRSAD
jgi:hypothetical protein